MPRVFISYVRENSNTVQRLVHALEAHGIEVWLDRNQIKPGYRWRNAIREAIAEGDFFIACFSAEYNSRSKTYMNAELTLAADELQQRPVDRAWFIPVLLANCPVPALSIGAGDTLHDIQWVELYDDWDKGVQRILRVVHPEAVSPIGMEFVLIPAGEFMMGSDFVRSNEQPIHKVHISKPFYLGKYPVTQTQWLVVIGGLNPSRFTGDPDRPIESVSWDNVQEFIRRLNDREGGTNYRLPTEAEWEYACRAGSTTAYSFGNDENQLGEYAWYSDNSGSTTHPVGKLKPNAWGLYDMHGNVWEWVQDRYGEDFYKRSPTRDPQGPDEGASRGVRGGSWINDARYCRAAFRGHYAPANRDYLLGFRLARSVALGP